MDYISAFNYYDRLSKRVWVNFVPGVFGNNSFKTILDGDMPYNEIVDLVSKAVFNGEVEPNKLLLKAKWKTSSNFHPVPHNNVPPLTISQLVKNDEKVQCEVTKIEVGLLDKKLKCIIHYFSIITNTRSNDEEIYIDKSSTVSDLVKELNAKQIFKAERDHDAEVLNKPLNLRVMLLEKKKHKLVGRAQNDQGLNTLMTKYKLRIEYIPLEYETETTEENKHYPIYCVHTTRDGEIFSNPFVIFLQRNLNALEIKAKIYDYIKEWEIYADKKITINEEQFAKIKYLMKSEISDTKFCKLETETVNPFQELDPSAKKYSLEIIYPFNISNYTQMKIQLN